MTKVADLSVDISVNGAQVAAQALKSVEAQGQSAGRAMHDLWTESGMVKLGMAAIAVEVASMANSYQQAYNKIKLFSDSAGQAVATQLKLVDIAIQSRTSLEDVTALYTKMTASSKELGANQSEVLTVTKAIGQTFVLSGASTQQAAMSANEFIRAISEGTINTRELKVLFGDNIALARALADGLGVGVGKLREMVTTGDVDGRKMFGAILNQADALNTKATSIAPTLSSGFSVLKVGMEAFVGKLDTALGITSTIGAIFSKIGQVLSTADIGTWLQNAGRMASGNQAGRIPLPLTHRPMVGLAGQLEKVTITATNTKAEADDKAARAATELAKRLQDTAHELSTFLRLGGDSVFNPSTGQYSTVATHGGALESLASSIDGARKGRMAQGIANVNAAGLPGADLSSSVGLIGSNITGQFGGLSDQLSSLGQGLGQVLVSSISTGISTAVESGSIKEGLRALTGSMLGGVGRMLVDFGTHMLIVSSTMQDLMSSLASFIPGGGIAASIALIGLGSVMVGLGQRAARSSFGGAGRSDGLGGGFNISAPTLPNTVSATGTYSSTAGLSMPSYNAPTGAVMSQGLSGVSASVINVFSPDDPTTQRFFRETMLRADRRGAF